MELILLEKVHQLGNLGDTVNVKPGYGRNYLVPNGKAVPANAKNKADFEERRADLEKLALKKLSSAEERVSALADFEIILTANASEEGKLYGSIGPREISDEVTSRGIELSKAEVNMPDGPIRFTGEHKVLVHLHADVETEIKVTINAE